MIIIIIILCLTRHALHNAKSMLFFILCYSVGRAFNRECVFFIVAVLVLIVKTPLLNMNMSMSMCD